MDAEPLLSCQGVNFSYEYGTKVLDDVSLEVARGGYGSIVGPSGSGKSSMLNILGLLNRPDDGQYLFDGMDTNGISDRQRSGLRGSRIGFVFQSYHLISHRSVDENVAMAELYTGRSRRGRFARADEALRQVGLEHKIGVPASRLSGGERQRVAIARALTGEPDLLLCDEPTGNLDTSNTRVVLDILDRIQENGITIMIITHDREVASRADQEWVMSDGRLELVRA